MAKGQSQVVQPSWFPTFEVKTALSLIAASASNSTIPDITQFWDHFRLDGDKTGGFNSLQILHVSLFWRKCVSENGLFAWPKTSASKALHHAKSNQHVSQCHYTQLVTGALLTWLIWRETPTVWMVAGSVLIVAAGLLMAVSMMREKAEVSPAVFVGPGV